MPAEQARHALILDFDGVLVDSEPVHDESWRRAFGEIVEVPDAFVPEDQVGLSLERIIARWCAALGLQLTPDEQEALLARKTEIFYALGAERLRPIAGSVALIRRARALGWYVTIASRARRLRLFGTLAIMQMPEHFDLVFSSEACVDRRTDRKNHARAARVFGIDPACCVVVEDSAQGVADARDAGIGWVIGLTTSLPAAELVAAGAHEVVAHLDDIDLAASLQTKSTSGA